MTVQSYLVYPEQGQQQRLTEALLRMEGCEVFPAENRELLVVVTTAENAEQEKALESALNSLEGAECVALVSGWSE